MYGCGRRTAKLEKAKKKEKCKIDGGREKIEKRRRENERNKRKQLINNEKLDGLNGG